MLLANCPGGEAALGERRRIDSSNQLLHWPLIVLSPDVFMYVFPVGTEVGDSVEDGTRVAISST